MHNESYLKDSWARLRSNGPALFSIWVLGILFLFAIFGPLLSPYSYSEIHLDLKNSPPSAQFWFGSDELGRDMFTRIWWGARISLFIGITAAIIGVGEAALPTITFML